MFVDIEIFSRNGCWFLDMFCSFDHPAAGNPDPLTNILGTGFVAMGRGSALLATHERLQRERARSTGDQAGEVDQLDDKFRLALLLNSLDIQLLQSSVQTLGR